MTISGEYVEGPPTEETGLLAERMFKVILPLVNGEQIDDVAMAMMYVSMKILSGCAGMDRHDRIDIFRETAAYFTEMARQESDA